MQTYKLPIDQNSLPLNITTVNMKPDSINLPADGYSFFVGQASLNTVSIVVDAVVGGKKYELFISPKDLFGGTF
jgi:hypothetical protein